MTAPDPIRLLIADDHPTFRAGLRALLASRDDCDIEIVGEAASGEEAVRIAASTAPDVVVMDLHMDGGGGIEATRRVVATLPAVRVLILTMLDDDGSVFAALCAGARGYILKGADQGELTRAIQAVAAGESIFGAGVAARVIAAFSESNGGRPPPAFPELTAREREVLELIADGRTNPDIAGKLFLSPKTVRNHVSNILNKLQLRDRGAAMLRARQAGLGSDPAPRA